MSKVVVITGAGAGVGRATVARFARNGCDVALLSRDPERLEDAAREARAFGVRALAIPTDVADSDAVEAAAARVEEGLGPIDVWVNVAMATVFSPVSKLTAAEVRRATEVTYLGQVYGMMAALRRMTPRNRGSIVNVGSALAYRSVPLQSVYCGAKFAIRGFTEFAAIGNLARQARDHDQHGGSARRQHAAILLGTQQDRPKSAADTTDLSTGGSRARNLLRGVSPAPANVDRVSHGESDPRQPYRARIVGPLSRERRLFRATHR